MLCEGGFSRSLCFSQDFGRRRFARDGLVASTFGCHREQRGDREQLYSERHLDAPTRLGDPPQHGVHDECELVERADVRRGGHLTAREHLDVELAFEVGVAADGEARVFTSALLVGMVDRLRSENARAGEENARLARELESARTRIADAENASSEVLALREERDLIRSRVDEMLQQIEGLNL